MKKFLIIMMVALMGIGMVFAADTETHTLNISITIDEVLPIFSLKWSDSHSNDSTTNFFPKTTAGTGTAAYIISDQAVAAGADLKDGSITVDAYVMNQAKQHKTYTLTFGGGAFDGTTGCTKLSFNGTATAVSPTKIEATTSITTDSTVAGINTVSCSGAVATVPFNGTKMTATAKSVVVASGTYTYGIVWDTVDPGTYTTNIVLTITT